MQNIDKNFRLQQFGRGGTMKKSMLAIASTALALGFSSSLAFADGATAVSIDNNPLIDMTTRTVSITGHVTCTLDESGDTVVVDVVIKQQWGNTDQNSPGYHYASASKSANVTAKCNGTSQPYQLFLKSTAIDDFKPGTSAHVTAFAHETETESGDATASAVADVTFQPAH